MGIESYNKVLYAFFWVIPWHLNFICQRFGTLSVPKRWHIKFRCQGITQKETYNIQNTAKVWNQECNKVPVDIKKLNKHKHLKRK